MIGQKVKKKSTNMKEVENNRAEGEEKSDWIGNRLSQKKQFFSYKNAIFQLTYELYNVLTHITIYTCTRIIK